MSEMEDDKIPATFDQIDEMLLNVNDDTIKKDFEAARANLLAIAEMGTESTKELMDIAAQSQHPSAYLALARMIETVVQANREILELQHSVRRITQASENISGRARNVTNNLYVGSTAQLQRILEDLQKTKIIDGEIDSD